MAIEYTEFNLTASDRLPIFGRRWLPSTPPKGVVCLVHGLSEHSGCYHFIGESFADAGYGFVAFDQRGHGHTGGQRGFTPSYLGQTMSDVNLLIQEGKKVAQDSPIFLYGHSLGGGIVLNHTLRFPNSIVHGVICTGPLLRLSKPPTPFEMRALKLFSRILPRLARTQYRPENEPKSDEECVLTRDFAREIALRRDPVRNRTMAHSLAYAGIQNGRWAMDRAHRFSKPLLLMHGSADKLTEPEASETFASRVAPELITLKIWEGAYHELHHELMRQDVADFMVQWLDQAVEAMLTEEGKRR